MLKLPPESALSLFQQDYDFLLSELKKDPNLLKHKDEMFAVWYASPFIKRVCLSQSQWLQTLFSERELHCDFNKEIYRKQLHQVVSDSDSIEAIQHHLRVKRAAAFARIAWRDLQHYSIVQQTLHELSAFAEICAQETLQWCFEWVRSRPSASEFVKQLPQRLVIFALGKLGGSELNFSSDIDIVFAYADDVEHTQEQAGKAIEFYLKVVQLFIKILSEQTQDGFVFRVDVRLRPFGNSGTLVPSFLSIDQYFQTHGRDWERYAWMKARVIAGDRHVGEQFLDEVSPFIYRRYLDYGAIQSLREMKALVDTKAHQESAKENLKIGYGGIREIEFIAQMFQLIYGGKDSSLRIRSTFQALKQLEEQGLLDTDCIEKLTDAYLFLRKAENGLQLREDQQIHSLPVEDKQREHFSYLLGMQNWQEFYSDYEEHVNIVNDLYQSLLESDDQNDKDNIEKSEFEKIWLQIDEKEYCFDELRVSFSVDAEHICTQLSNFSQSSLVQKLIPVARQRLDYFIPIFLQQLIQYKQPKIVFDRFLNILKKIVQRSTYISLLIENEYKLSKIFSLIQASPWVSQYLATYPLLLDEILSMDEDYQPPSMLEMQQQLHASLQNNEEGLESYMQRLREFKHSQAIQIAAADVIEDYPIMKVSDHLSWLAETCINSAVHYAYRDLVEKYGEPRCEEDTNHFTPEVLIVEYGKLGGLELGYGSDLDIVFLHNSVGMHCETVGSESEASKKIHNDIFFTRLVQRAIHILSTVTSSGKVFETDLRLRPHGESGPIVSSIKAYENYLMNDAWLWEHQALVRARAISNSKKLNNEFERIRQKILCLTRKVCDVQTSVIEMRNKMLDAYASSSKEGVNLKKDIGGVIDIEFIVQFLVLSYSSEHPQICKHTDNVRILDACAGVGLLEQGSSEELKEIYLKFRKYLHQQSLKLLPESQDMTVFASERDTVQKYWTSLLHFDET